MNLYFECFSGISGDMTLGALVDLGVPQEYLIAELAKLNVEGYHLHFKSVKKQGIGATHAKVHLEHHHDDHHHDDHHHDDHHHDDHHHDDHHHDDHHHDEHQHGEHHHDEHHHGEHNHDDHHHDDHHHEHRNLKSITDIINKSEITTGAKERAIKMFETLAKAEATVHQTTVDEIHFHEVGAIDSIVDIIGCAICIDYLKPQKIMFSHIYEGCGHVKCAHGIMPVPVPATMELAKMGGIPLKITKTKGEMITPTGATIALCLADEFVSEAPTMVIEKIGYGAGTKEFGHANILRVCAYNEIKSSPDVVVLESNLDDATGEVMAYTMEKLFQAGARDVFFTPIYMKKNRPAQMLSVICDEENRKKMENIIFENTTTIGIRFYMAKRTILKRENIVVETLIGEADVKVCEHNNTKYFYPEFESVKKISSAKSLPFKEVYNQVIKSCQND